MRAKGQYFDLKSFRRKYNITQKEVSEAVNRPQSFISLIESGRRSAPAAMLDELVSIYNEENISNFLHDRTDPSFGDVSNVHDSIVNSPGGTVLVNEFRHKLSDKDLLRILEIEREAREDEELKKIEEIPVNKQATIPSQNDTNDLSMIASLVNLLSASEARNKESEKKIKLLEAENLELRAKLRIKSGKK